MAPVVVDVASSVATPGPASSPAATPPPEVPAAAVQLTEESPLGGKGRALTEQEIGLLNYGIYMFKEEKGRYPSSLQEAVTARYIARLPELPSGQSYQYDATSGQVKIEGAK